MAKLSSQIYQDLVSIKEDGRGQLTTNFLLAEICYALVNYAYALESINVAVAGPVNSLTAASLDALVSAIDETDTDEIMSHHYLKQIGFLAVKAAMESESILASFGGQAKTATLETALSLTSLIDIDALSKHVKSAGFSLGASIDIDSKSELALGASLGVEALLYQSIVNP